MRKGTCYLEFTVESPRYFTENLETSELFYAIIKSEKCICERVFS